MARRTSHQLGIHPLLIETSLVANDGSSKESVSFDIPDNEWEQFLQFRRHADNLRATRFVQERHGGSISLRWGAAGSAHVTTKHVDEEAVWAMLLKLRPFVLQNELSFVPSTIGTLKRRLTHVAFHRHLDLLRDAYTLKQLERRLNLQGVGRPPLSYQVVMDWLNSYQYHFDSTKRAAVERDMGSLGNVQNGVGAVLIALVEMIQSSLSTGDFIETLERCVEGTMPEISCPIEYFEVSRK